MTEYTIVQRLLMGIVSLPTFAYSCYLVIYGVRAGFMEQRMSKDHPLAGDPWLRTGVEGRTAWWRGVLYTFLGTAGVVVFATMGLIAVRGFN